MVTAPVSSYLEPRSKGKHCKGRQGIFGDDGHIPCLDYGRGYRCVHIHGSKLITLYVLKISPLFNICKLYFNRIDLKNPEPDKSHQKDTQTNVVGLSNERTLGGSSFE